MAKKTESKVVSMASREPFNEAKAGMKAHHANQVAARVIGVKVQKSAKPGLAGDDVGGTRELPEDPFQSLAAMGKVLEPPFELLTLAMLPENNTELNQ